MQKKFLKGYPILFILVVFTGLFIQLFGRELTLDLISEKFLWRNELIKKWNNIRFQLGDNVFSQAIVGKDEWMYYTGDKSIGDYQKVLKVGPRETKDLLQNLELFDDWVTKNDGKLFLVVAPDKQTIYPQYMPDEIPVFGEYSRFDRILTYWSELEINVSLVDLRAPLIEASSVHQVYQKGDTHWNCVGAYYAYQEIMNQVSIFQPGTEPYSLDEFEIRYQTPKVRDIPGMLGIDHLEEGLDLVPKFVPNQLDVKEQPLEYKGYARIVENQNKDLPTALIIHDSFYPACFNVLFEQHFSRTYAIHYAFVKSYRELIKEQKADVVILETVERYLLTRLSYIGVN